MFAINIQSTFPENNAHEGIVVGVFDDGVLHSGVKLLDEQLEGQLNALLKAKKLSTKLGECTPVYTVCNSSPKVIYILGFGKKENVTTEQVRVAMVRIGIESEKDKVTDLAIFVESLVSKRITIQEVSTLIGEGLALGSYRVLHYKEKTESIDQKLASVTLYGPKENSLQVTKAVQIGYTYGMGTNRARALVNLPGNLLTPTDLAEEAKELAKKYNFNFDVIEKEEMEKLGMGALLAVASGSDQPPKMIVIKYEGNKNSNDVIGFVGKGLTFDTGGISIKPSTGMHEMKMDMGGAAAVLGAMDIIGSLKPNVNVLAVIPSSENMINGSALKPGDVIRSLSGKTIEVLNTDAEGRLILADGMTYAKQLGATSLIDVATLTGAVLIALGDCTTGAVTNDEAMLEEILEASTSTGEWIWGLPSYQPYKDMLKTSDVADLNNAPGRLAGSITGGLFIGEFAGKTPWVHLDIAGTAWQSKKKGLGPAGGTGVMARTLAKFAINKGLE